MLRTVWLAWVPPGHGCGALEPRTHKYPGVHSSHSVLLDTDVYLPGAHRSHVDFPLLDAYEPGRHAVGVTEPVAHEDPAGQSVQSEARVRFAVLE
jgi:hypothetical protein